MIPLEGEPLLTEGYAVVWSMSALESALLGSVLLLILSLLARLLRWRRYAYDWTARFFASPEFLKAPEWRRVRYDALQANDGRCELCGRNKHQFADGEYLNVDHIHNRKARPDLSLEITILAVLCTADNASKGNRYADDWRHPTHPHRQRS